VRLIDLAPTALAVLGRPAPTTLFAGSAAVRVGGRPSELTTAVRRLADADQVAREQRRVSGGFFAVLAVGQLLLYGGLIPLLRRARRPPGPAAPPVSQRLVRLTEAALIAAALAVPAALVADLVPWWRFALPGTVFAAATVAVLAVGTALVVFGASRYRSLGPLGGVAAMAATTVALDVLTGARLQLNGVAGYSALSGGRYIGLGTIGLGLFIAGVLLLAGCLAQQVDQHWRPVVVTAAGCIGVVIIGSPYLGANAGGAVGLTAGLCVAAAMSTGGWLTPSRLTWAVLAAIGASTAFAVLDAQRPAEQRSRVAQFLSHLADGGGLVINRTGSSAVVTVALTMLVIGSAAFTWVVLLRPWGGLRRLFGIFPAVRGALVGVVVATVIAGLIEGAGLNVTGAALATALPLTALAALRVRHHADDRTQPVRIGPDLLAAPPVLAD
jgi:hypothetical protein